MKGMLEGGRVERVMWVRGVGKRGGLEGWVRGWG